jgi:hypothetical protein
VERQAAVRDKAPADERVPGVGCDEHLRERGRDPGESGHDKDEKTFPVEPAIQACLPAGCRSGRRRTAKLCITRDVGYH